MENSNSNLDPQSPEYSLAFVSAEEQGDSFEQNFNENLLTILFIIIINLDEFENLNFFSKQLMNFS